jgi:TRAP-type C4-dicarboxylate transport system permease small subunit
LLIFSSANKYTKKVLNALSRNIAFIEEACLGISLIIITGLIFGNVFSRFVLGRPYAWPDETAKFLHVVGIYLGVAVASRRNIHLRIDLVPLYIPSLKRIYSLVLPIGGVIFSGIFIYFAYKFFLMEHMVGDKGYVTSIPIWIIALLILLAGILIFIRESQRLFEMIVTSKNEQKTK